MGGAPKIDPEGAIDEAVELAKKSDVAVIIVGLNSDWESEGFDRPTFDMPGLQNELIEQVAKVNQKTVVVIQAVSKHQYYVCNIHSLLKQGSAVSMPWRNSVAGIIQAWLSGNELGNALADIIYGRVNPSGKLPITLPAREEDVPAYLNYGAENGEVHYREDLFVGYKWYQARKISPLYPFG